jgi:hypothetical protein
METMMPTGAQISSALRQQVENCLGRANGFVKHPQLTIAEAKSNGGSPSGMIGSVAFGLEGVNPSLAAKLKAIAEEIDAVAQAYEADRLSPPAWPGSIPDRLRHLREMIATVGIEHL